MRSKKKKRYLQRMIRETATKAISEFEGHGLVVQWLVFNQFAVASGMSIGTSLALFLIVRAGWNYSGPTVGPTESSSDTWISKLWKNKI